MSTRNIGDEAPPFELPTQRGALVTLSDVLQRGPALIAFPGRLTNAAADTRIRALARVYSRLRDAGVELLVIVPNGAEQAKRYVEEVGTPFHLLCDNVDLTVAVRYGVRRRLSLRADTRPALFAVDRGGVIHYRLLDTWNDQSPAFSDAFSHEKTNRPATP